jgi:hypothetical protein
MWKTAVLVGRMLVVNLLSLKLQKLLTLCNNLNNQASKESTWLFNTLEIGQSFVHPTTPTWEQRRLPFGLRTQRIRLHPTSFGTDMDNQQLFNIVVSVAAFFAVYVINNFTRQIQKLEDRVNSLPHDYVQKDDYRVDVKELKEMVKQIFDKLDQKQDK